MAIHTDDTPKHSHVRFFHALRWVYMAAFGTAYLLSIPYAYDERMQEASQTFRDFFATTAFNASMYAAYFIFIEFTVVLVSFTVAGILFLRQPARRAETITGMTLIAISLVASNNVNYLANNLPQLMPLWVILTFFGLSLFFHMLLIFPNGRFIPRWTRWFNYALMLYALLMAYHDVVLKVPFPNMWWVGLMPWSVLGLGTQIYRFNRFSSQEERQQTKWVIYGMAILFVSMSFFVFVDMTFRDYLIARPPLRFFYRIIMNTLFVRGATIVLSLSVAFAILKHRLWSIDLLVNQTLVVVITGIVSMVLASGMNILFNLYAGSGVSLALALMFAVAALPISRRAVRFGVDHYLYRLRFDLDQLREGQVVREIQNRGKLSETEFAGYMLHDLLGTGAMSEVYLAERDGEVYAVKILDSTRESENNAVQQFERETEILQPLSHPNVIQFYDAGLWESHHYIVLQFVDGPSLKHHMAEFGIIPVPDMLNLVTGICHALDYIHEQNVVHRDIKPGNILLQRQPELATYQTVLSDFGLAKSPQHACQKNTHAVGTIGYMAPEQITSGRVVDHRADVYALSAMLFEMLTGRLPFTGKPEQIMFAHLRQPPPHPSEFVEDIPPHVEYAILIGLSKDPDDRYQSASELLDNLNNDYTIAF